MDPATMDFPFDVLGVIFDYYLDEETIDFPLETMLSVCRSWNEAALGHRNLWARLKIYLAHFPTSELWNIRLPRRLERAGNSTLLEIDLRSILDSLNSPQKVRIKFDWCIRLNSNPYNHLSCSCIHTARSTTKELLIMLAGHHGELCHRWKSLYLCTSQFINLGKELAYPTPNLEAIGLELPSISRNVSIPPSIPKLKSFEIFRPHSFALPKIENVRDVIIRSLGIDWVSDLSNIKTATNIETLTIEIWKNISIDSPIPYFLPDLLPHLSSLSFSGNQLPYNLNALQAPNIQKLSLNFDDTMSLKTVVNSSLPFWDLQELELTWPNNSLRIHEEDRATISDLLLSCINLTRIKGDRKALSVIVKLYWEECATRSIEREYAVGETLTFKSNDLGREVSVRRPEGKSELEGVAFSLRLILPSVSWEFMLAVCNMCIVLPGF
jgi:hypothetical protein